MNNSDEFLNEENIDKYCEALSEELLKANLGEHTEGLRSMNEVRTDARNRYGYIDYCKALCIVFVVLLHSGLESLQRIFDFSTPLFCKKERRRGVHHLTSEVVLFFYYNDYIGRSQIY